MTSLETLRAFFGWCAVINGGMLALASLILMSMRGTISSIHMRMSGLDEADLARAYFQYLAHYKIAFLVLNLVPYVALVIIS